MAHANPAVGVIDTLLRGVGQVMFQNNPITGLLFLVGIFINSYKYGLTALLGLVVATFAAYLLGADRTLIRNGLFGFNGVLTGIALSVFLQWDWHVAVYIILGAIVSTIAMMGLAKVLISWDIAPLTAPFVLTAWLLLFAIYPFGQLHPTKLIGPMPVHPGAAIQTDLQEAGGGGAVGLTAANLANALFRGVGEVFLQDNLWTGVVFAIAILVNSRLCLGFALLGSALGSLTALVLGGDGVSIYHGRLRLQRGPDRDRPRRRVPGAQLAVDDLRVDRGDLQRDRVRRHRRRAVPDRHASADRSVRAHDLGVPAADVRFQSTAAGLGRRGARPRVDPRGLGCAGSRRPAGGDDPPRCRWPGAPLTATSLRSRTNSAAVSRR